MADLLAYNGFVSEDRQCWERAVWCVCRRWGVWSGRRSLLPSNQQCEDERGADHLW
jgi:hypothetical protein